MTYSILATSAMGIVKLHRGDAEGALKKARELQRDSYMDVRIVDPAGAVHSPDEFAAALAGQDGGADTLSNA